jgi:hypothetical protein
VFIAAPTVERQPVDECNRHALLRCGANVGSFFEAQYALDQAARIGLRRWHGPSESLGGGQLSGSAVVLTIAPEVNELGDRADAAMQLGDARCDRRVVGAGQTVRPFEQPFEQEPRFAIPELPRKPVIVQDRPQQRADRHEPPLPLEPRLPPKARPKSALEFSYSEEAAHN